VSSPDSIGALVAMNTGAGSASNDMTARAWDVSPGSKYTCLRTLVGHTHAVTGVCFGLKSLHEGQTVVVVTASRDASLRVWNSFSGELLGTLTGHTDWVRKCASPLKTKACIDQGTNVGLVVSGGSDHVSVVLGRVCPAVSASSADRSSVGPGDHERNALPHWSFQRGRVC
jgi:WD40 repeat protein